MAGLSNFKKIEWVSILKGRLTIQNIGWIIAIIFGAGVVWNDLNTQVAASDEKNSAQDKALEKHEEKIDGIEDTLGKLETGQAVLRESAENQEQALRRIEGKLDGQ